MSVSAILMLCLILIICTYAAGLEVGQQIALQSHATYLKAVVAGL